MGKQEKASLIDVWHGFGSLVAQVTHDGDSGNAAVTLPLESELRRVLTFERLFRIPVWYAYLHEEDGATVWYWISALKAIEVGEVRKNSKTGEDFVAIKLEHFERIEKNEDLGKLYTHRLPSLNGIHKA